MNQAEPKSVKRCLTGIRRIMRCLPVAISLFWPRIHPAAAADAVQMVPGHPNLSYFDLTKHVWTDLAPGGSARANQYIFAPVRQLNEDTASPDEPPEYLELRRVEVMTIPGDRTRAVLFASLNSELGNRFPISLLALFAIEPKIRLLDVVETGGDRWTSPRDKIPVMLAPNVALVIIDSGHDNSNQNYLSTEMIFTRGDRFESIDRIFTFSDRDCATNDTQTLTVVARPSPGGFRAVHAIVREVVTLTGEVCEVKALPRPGVTLHRATYRWDPQRRRYVTPSTELIELQKRNVQRW